MKKIIYSVFLVILLAAAVSHIYGNDKFGLEEVAAGLESPWAVAFLPDSGGILVTGRKGTITLINGNERTEITGIPPVAAVGQGGLLDLVTDPGFRNNRKVYFSYARQGSGGYSTAVAGGELAGNRLVNVKTIFTARPETGGGLHFGSRLAFDNSGYLYITTGDRGNMKNGQDLMSHAGKVLRIFPDGTIPSDNPFYGRKDALPEIYSYGHRNAQGLVYDSKRDILWLHEHGPRGGDEVNIIRKGGNYGWPEATFGVNYSGTPVSEPTSISGMEDPRLHWTPSIAPSGLDIYYGDVFPEWRGNLFAGALAGQRLVRIETDGKKVLGQEIFLAGEIGRIRDVRVSPDGYIYLLTDGGRASLYRMKKPK